MAERFHGVRDEITSKKMHCFLLIVAWVCWIFGVMLPIVELIPFPILQGQDMPSYLDVDINIPEKIEKSTFATLRLLHERKFFFAFAILLFCSVVVPILKLTAASLALFQEDIVHPTVITVLASLSSYQLVDLCLGILFVVFCNNDAFEAHLRIGFGLWVLYCVLSQALMLALERELDAFAIRHTSVPRAQSDLESSLGPGRGRKLHPPVLEADVFHSLANGLVLACLVYFGCGQPMLSTAITFNGIALSRTVLGLKEIFERTCQQIGFVLTIPAAFCVVGAPLLVATLALVSVCARRGGDRGTSEMLLIVAKSLTPWVMADVFSLSLVTFLFAVQGDHLHTTIPDGKIFGITTEWVSGFYIGLGLGAAGFSLKWKSVHWHEDEDEDSDEEYRPAQEGPSAFASVERENSESRKWAQPLPRGMSGDQKYRALPSQEQDDGTSRSSSIAAELASRTSSDARRPGSLDGTPLLGSASTTPRDTGAHVKCMYGDALRNAALDGAALVPDAAAAPIQPPVEQRPERRVDVQAVPMRFADAPAEPTRQELASTTHAGEFRSAVPQADHDPFATSPFNMPVSTVGDEGARSAQKDSCSDPAGEVEQVAPSATVEAEITIDASLQQETPPLARDLASASSAGAELTLEMPSREKATSAEVEAPTTVETSELKDSCSALAMQVDQLTSTTGAGAASSTEASAIPQAPSAETEDSSSALAVEVEQMTPATGAEAASGSEAPAIAQPESAETEDSSSALAMEVEQMAPATGAEAASSSGAPALAQPESAEAEDSSSALAMELKQMAPATGAEAASSNEAPVIAPPESAEAEDSSSTPAMEVAPVPSTAAAEPAATEATAIAQSSSTEAEENAAVPEPEAAQGMETSTAAVPEADGAQATDESSGPLQSHGDGEIVNGQVPLQPEAMHGMRPPEDVDQSSHGEARKDSKASRKGHGFCGKLLRNPIFHVKAASWIIWGVCYFCVKGPEEFTYMKMNHAVEGVLPLLNGWLARSLPRSVGDCSASSLAPAPCVGDGPIYQSATHSWEGQNVLARWVTGVNTVRFETISLHALRQSQVIEVGIRGQILDLSMSIRVEQCLLGACKVLWDSTDGCCKPNRQFDIGIATDCVTDEKGEATLGDFHVEWFNIDEISLSEKVLGYQFEAADLTPRVKTAVQNLTTNVFQGEAMLFNLTFAEVISRLWRYNTAGGVRCRDFFADNAGGLH